MTLVSVIIPVYNGEKFILNALNCVINQTYRPLEVVVFDDASTDKTFELATEFFNSVSNINNINVILKKSNNESPKGPGFGRNEAILLSTGSILCHLDVDDEMDSTRIDKQVNLYKSMNSTDCLIGCNFSRVPEDSTPYYVSWINSLTNDQLTLQQYRECTIICPTWLYSRTLYNKVASNRRIENGDLLNNNRGFVEKGDYEAVSCKVTRVPEDLFFFLDVLEHGGTLAKVDGEPLVVYTYTPNSWALGTKSQDLQRVRLRYLERRILSLSHFFSGFCIWGYGKDGRKVLNMLSDEFASKVVSFCDISVKKIGTEYFSIRDKRRIPVVHFSKAVGPFLICVGSKRTKGELENNIDSLNLIEGFDYIHFS